MVSGTGVNKSQASFFSAGSLIFCLLFVLNASASPTAWSAGDVLVARTDGTVQVRSANGALKATLNPVSAGAAKGLLLDSFGNLLVSHWWVPDRSGGNTVEVFRDDGTYAGIFGPGAHHCQPSGMVLGPNGNVFIAYTDCLSDIVRFDAAGNPVQGFNVAFENAGPRWMDLAADGCTMYYTSVGHFISRYNVCTSTQLPNFNVQPLPSTSGALGLRILPDGGVIVADIQAIYRLDAGGNLVATYDAVGDDYFVSVFLDPDGTSFWSSSFGTSNVYKFDIATGAVLMSFHVGGPGARAKAVIVVPPTLPPPSDGRMTGGGNFFTQGGMKVTHGFQLRCSVDDPRQNLEINWAGGKFHLQSVSSVYCYDDPAINPENPDSPIDTLILTGTGRLRGNEPGTITLKFTDAGEPGTNRDSVTITVKDAAGNTVLYVAPIKLNGGNHQAHRATGRQF